MIKLFADTASNLPVALNKKYNVNINPNFYFSNPFYMMFGRFVDTASVVE